MSKPASQRVSKAAGSREARAMIVAGVMSGTSADGVDVAMCRVSPASRSDSSPKVKVLGHRSFAYDKKLRASVLAAMDAQSISAAELARLSWRLGEVYAECVAKTSAELNVKPQLVACHGQTIYHQASAKPYLGNPLKCTWQLGEAALIAERIGVPVVSDFRPADMAAGGQAAPLVPMLDYVAFRHAMKSRVLLNLGGIANVTALPAGCDTDGVLAFDTGPANMIVDALMQRLYGKRFDKNGAVAARGKVLRDVVQSLLRAPYFSALPPKSCGREEYGEVFVTRFMKLCCKGKPEDVIATATAFTAESVLDAYRRFCWPHLGQRAPLARTTEVLAAGGGTNNATLMRMLRDGFAELGVKLMTTYAAGIAVEAKEAAAFALLGWLTWHGLPGNIPAATGAKHAVVLGKVSLV